ncbi:unnamed protein product [Rotaria sp. Silwood2]|nr:unnamed protein product [Rotaria sp. Silwood2]
MEKTKAFKCFGTEDPLPDLIKRTNKYLLDLRLAKWITQKQYEKLCINPNEVELAHLYYLPKAHKPGTHLPSRTSCKYIDDIFIALDLPARHLLKQIDKWNHFDENIKLFENIGSTANFLDLHIKSQDGQLFTTVYQKPSYEPYYLPFKSIHLLHMKKNIIFTMLLRTIRYCSSFQAYLNEREKLRMALLLNKYPNKFINEQFNNVFLKINIDQFSNKRKIPIDYEKTMVTHFTYCSNMETVPTNFHILWDKYFGNSPINEIIPILGTRNVNNLQRRLVHTRLI